jgi:hypothetical protein
VGIGALLACPLGRQLGPLVHHEDQRRRVRVRPGSDEALVREPCGAVLDLSGEVRSRRRVGPASLPTTRALSRSRQGVSSTRLGSMPTRAVSRWPASPASTARSAVDFPEPGLPVTSRLAPYSGRRTSSPSSSMPRGTGVALSLGNHTRRLSAG